MTSTQWSDLPEVYHTDFPEVAPSHQQFSPEALHAGKYDEGLESVPNSQYLSAPGTAVTVTPPRYERRICGIKRTLFIILAIVGAIVIIGAIVGGAVGGAMAAKSSKSSSDSSDTTATATTTASTPSATRYPTSISPKSGLASVNWTDSSGYSHYYVFHQARDNTIVASIWDSQNKTWQARNVSADVANSDGSLNVIAGTPIAAIAWADNITAWNIRLYVLLTGNLIGELYTTDPSAESQWAQYPNSPSFVAGEGSQLAAWRGYSGGCHTYPIILAWQVEGKLMYANGTQDDWTDMIGFDEQAVNKSGIAFTDLNAGTLAFKLYFDSSGAMLEMQGDPDDIAGFGFGNNKGSIGDLTGARSTNYAAVSFDDLYLLVANVNDDGSVAARNYDNTAWSSDTTPSLLNSPSSILASENFTAIAMNKDKRVYGLVADSIHEWKFTQSSPTDWTYVGEVNTTISS